jgi:Flp pilus assembly pilin Flp
LRTIAHRSAIPHHAGAKSFAADMLHSCADIIRSRVHPPFGGIMKYGKAIADLVGRAVNHASHGQGLAEYALILALIAIVAIVALIFLGGQVSGILNKVGTSV